MGLLRFSHDLIRRCRRCDQLKRGCQLQTDGKHICRLCQKKEQMIRDKVRTA